MLEPAWTRIKHIYLYWFFYKMVPYAVSQGNWKELIVWYALLDRGKHTFELLVMVTKGWKGPFTQPDLTRCGVGGGDGYGCYQVGCKWWLSVYWVECCCIENLPWFAPTHCHEILVSKEIVSHRSLKNERLFRGRGKKNLRRRKKWWDLIVAKQWSCHLYFSCHNFQKIACCSYPFAFWMSWFSFQCAEIG